MTEKVDLIEDRKSGRPENIFARMSDVFPQDKLLSMGFTLIGAGSLGSHTAHCISMMGAEHITVFDDDRVEPHNLAVQLLGKKGLDKPKVLALKASVRNLHGVEIVPENRKFTEKDDIGGFVISCVDSMAVRKLVWDRVKFNAAVPYYIDTRAAGRVATVICIDPHNEEAIKKYEEKFLFDDEEAVEAPCTEKMTTPIAWGVASIVGGLLIKYLRAEDMPFALHYDMTNMVIVGEE